MMIIGLWKYDENSKVKHYFYKNGALISICGVDERYLMSGKWKQDRLGILSREFCGRCSSIVRRSKSLRDEGVFQNSGWRDPVRTQKSQHNCMDRNEMLALIQREKEQEVKYSGIWKYLQGGSVKHEFFKEDMVMAVCGRNTPWWKPEISAWLNDEEGLEERKYCKNCVARHIEEK